MAFSLSSLISFFILAALFSVLTTPAISSPASSRSCVASYCDSWRLAVETNNAGSWNVTPLQCTDYILNDYYNGGQFDSDYNLVASYAIAFAKMVNMTRDGKDAWIFDIDETLLSGFGSKPYMSTPIVGTLPAFDASLKLYKTIKKLGFTIFLITGRGEEKKSFTLKNLWDVGYFGWKKLIFKGEEDKGKTSTQYKSEQRSKLIKEGFKIHGSTGDQWSDLLGFAVADRSFKVPNPRYYIA